MEFLQPATLAEALALRAQHEGAVPVAGGTDLLVELNFDRRRPEVLLDLSRIGELRTWTVAQDPGDGAMVRLGSGVPYTELMAVLGDELPGLAMAARTVGSPQIRNRGTVGGNLGTASPAGDALPPLVASDSQVEVASAARGTRVVPAATFVLRPKHSVLEPDELIVAIHVPVARGPQRFAKVGTRNAMVIAVCSLSLHLDVEAREVGIGIGSAGPTPLRAPEAESFLAGALDECDGWATGALPGDDVVTRFGELVGAAASPIDDVRGTAAYRRHALSVLGRRTLAWTLDERRMTVA